LCCLRTSGSRKYLKYVLEQVAKDESEMRSHKLQRINDRIESKDIKLELSREDLLYLSDFYIDARYPGDDFIEVTDDMRIDV
jgi:HEPN domain-containing protein